MILYYTHTAKGLANSCLLLKTYIRSVCHLSHSRCLPYLICVCCFLVLFAEAQRGKAAAIIAQLRNQLPLTAIRAAAVVLSSLPFR